MADFIIHHNGAYNIFGTIADGVHYVEALTLDQLREVIKEEHGNSGLVNLSLRLERAQKTGCSGHDWTLDDCIAANRWNGDGEDKPGCMPRDEFIRRYLTLPETTDAARQEGGVQPCWACDGSGKVNGQPCHNTECPARIAAIPSGSQASSEGGNSDGR